jgi:RND family efflux transporter MFP subunit
MADQEISGLRIDKSGTTAGNHPSRLRIRRVWWLTVVCVVLISGLAAKGLLTPRVEVETATVSLVYPSQTFTLLNASGYVVAQRKSAVAAKATGRLVWLGVEEGSRVRAGEVIARLESDDVAATRSQAEANLVNARATLEQAEAELKDATLAFTRNQGLLAQGVVAQADLDASEARYRKAKGGANGAAAAINAARAALKGADVAVGYTLIRAPFDAVVLTKDAEIGDIVTPIGAAVNAKAAVVTMADMGSLQAEADVSESNLQKVRVGQPCEIQLDALPETRFSGTVHMIVPTADRSKATVLVKVRFDSLDSRILPEMSARVAFLQRGVKENEKRPRTAVNPAALVKRNNRDVIYLVKGERVVESPVTVGTRIGDLVEILAGAKAGDKVALKPLERLKDGTKIKTAEK